MAYKFNTNDVGFWFDGTMGQAYNDRCVVKLAMYHGFRLPDGVTLTGYLDVDDDPTYDAVKYLNTLEKPDGCSWDWRDGDFGLWLDDDEG